MRANPPILGKVEGRSSEADCKVYGVIEVRLKVMLVVCPVKSSSVGVINYALRCLSPYVGYLPQCNGRGGFVPLGDLLGNPC